VDFLEKPVKPGDLILALERALATDSKEAARKKARIAANARLQHLSPREWQILRGLLAGMSNKEVARRLDISPRTVEMHRANMMADLGVTGLADVIRLAIDAELTPLEARDDAGPTAEALGPPAALRHAKRRCVQPKTGPEGVLPPVLDVLEGTTDSVFLLDRDFTIVFLNRNAIESVSGGRDLVGVNLWDAFPGARQARAWDHLTDAAAERKPVRFEFFEPDLGCWFDVNVRPIPNGLQVFFRDLTAERAAMGELSRSEERLRLALEASGDGAWDLDLASGRIEMSPRFLAGLGYETNAIAGSIEGARSLIHPDDWPEVQRRLHLHLDDAAPSFVCEYRVRAKNGEWRWMLDRGRIVARDPATGRPTRLVGTTSDIGWLKAMQSEAQAATERIALAQQGAGAGTWDFDLNSRMVRICARSREMHGLAADGPEEIGEAEWASTIHPDDLDRARAALGRAVETGQTSSSKYRTLLPDGRTRRILTLGKVVLGEDGKPQRFVGIKLDVTESEIAARELKRLQAELANVSGLSAMGAMASTLAHELNQPLTAIANYVHGLRRGLRRAGIPEVNFIDALNGAEQSALTAGKIVRKLRDQAAGRRGERTFESLSRIISEAALLALPGADKAAIDLDVSVAPEADRVLVEQVQVKQVLINLMRNAVDAMRATGGGRIAVSAASAPTGQVEVEVADQGCGIQAEISEKLFLPFVTSKPNGTGIGLSICRSIVETHGGTICAAPAPDRGTVIRFTLPAA
jgi:two-component system sensor kinase FixL